MSKKFKSQASSARAASAAFGSSSPALGFQSTSSSLSYIAEQPDLAAIVDPHVVVSLRNLGKKDSTTKAKALEELHEYVTAAESVDAAILDAWVSLYPRTSIDNARRVRQLAHGLQGALTSLAGRRIAPLLPKVIGPWLSGAYDSDRIVCRAAQDSIARAFPTEEKRRALWKVYTDPMVEYAKDAVLQQTAATLSDERSTSADDAQAKLARVAGNAIVLFSQIIRATYAASDSPSSSVTHTVDELINSKKLWDYVSHDDASLRKATLTLAIVAADLLATHLDWSTLSTCLIGKALHRSQLGSAGLLAEALLALTTRRPTLWTTDYASKTAAGKRLLQYLKKGSQRGPAEFWTNTSELLRAIPVQVWNPHAPSTDAFRLSSSELLDALQEGMTSADEPRQNLQIAWSVYVDAVFWILILNAKPSQAALVTTHLQPLIKQYVKQDPRPSAVALPTAFDAALSAGIVTKLLQHAPQPLFEGFWSHIARVLVDQMKLSLPETSHDYNKSQDNVFAQGQRYVTLQSLVLQSCAAGSSVQDRAQKAFRESDQALIDTGIQLLQNRHGMPYGSAAILNGLKEQPHVRDYQPLVLFLQSDALNLLDTPSGEHLIGLLVRPGQNIESCVSKLLALVQLEQPGQPRHASHSLVRLLALVTDEQVSAHPDLQSFVVRELPADIASTGAIAKAVLFNGALLSSPLHGQCFGQIFDCLSAPSDPSSQHSVLRFLADLVATQGSAAFLSRLDGGNLLARLLLLSDSNDIETAELAASLIAKLKALPATSQRSSSSSTVVSDQLSGKGAPLSIFLLIDLAKDTLAGAPSDQPGLVSALMPSAAQWVSALQPHVHARPPPALAITNPLHGVVFVIESDQRPPLTPQPHDADEFSILFRLVFYVTKLLDGSDLFTRFTPELRRALYSYYPLAMQLVNEKFTIETANDLWHNTTTEVTDEAADILSRGQALIHQWLEDSDLMGMWAETIRSTRDVTPVSFFTGLAFTDIAARHVDGHGPSQLMSSVEDMLKDVSRSPDVIRAASLIAVFRDHLSGSQQGRKLLNELVVMSTDVKPSPDLAKGLRPLILLNALLEGSSHTLDAIPSQRLMFLLQALLRLLEEPQQALPYQVEALKLLEVLATATRDVYGTHWEQILQYLTILWQDDSDLDEDLPRLNAALRLYARLRGLALADEANEDLADAWKVAKPSLEDGLLHCLGRLGQLSTEGNQPCQITADLLRRQLLHVSVQPSPRLYGILSSSEAAIRGAAYDLFHRSIPAEQENVSMELVLEHKVVHLPAELMALISDGPGAESPEHQSYLLACHLIFDHFPKASYKLREMYAQDIKDSQGISRLLDLICDICRITSPRPLDASKGDIKTFDLGDMESPREEEERLTMHLYYCCLLYVPNLTRLWFIDQKNRIKSPLEAWTQKHFSPTLTTAALATVVDWAQQQTQSASVTDPDDATTLTIRPSLSGSEATASIAIDPESPPISLTISLPSTYPLDAPTVSPKTRVGVSEKNWQSWLRTIQIIIFGTGSIIEGLVAFRRNVQGALKGQTECAICYCIIGTDMQTPNKRCGTCRNMFHGACLFRWFKSSNSSSCPLCRNNFNYA